eukprot:6347550-Prymnesium_polylepis.1
MRKKRGPPKPKPEFKAPAWLERTVWAARAKAGGKEGGSSFYDSAAASSDAASVDAGKAFKGGLGDLVGKWSKKARGGGRGKAGA